MNQWTWTLVGSAAESIQCCNSCTCVLERFQTTRKDIEVSTVILSSSPERVQLQIIGPDLQFAAALLLRRVLEMVQ